MSVKSYNVACNITNLPKSFVKSSKKLHKDEDVKCKICHDAEIGVARSPSAVYEKIPWTKWGEMPPCLWALGYRLFYYPDEFRYERQNVLYDYVDAVLYKGSITQI